MNLFEFELQVRRKMRKGMLKIHMRALGLTCSTHAWNWSEFGPHWQGLSAENIEVGIFKFQKIQNHSEIDEALRGVVVRRN